MAAKKRTRKAKPKPVKRKPAVQVGTGGRFQPGQSGNPAGRPKGRDFKTALQRYIDENDYDIDKAAGELAVALFDAGKSGDTQAAKLWLDRCYGLQRQDHHIAHEGEINTGPPVPAPVELGEGIAKLAELSERHGLNGQADD